MCIVGAGYTGLWTAYYLKQADPSLRITVLEARFAGFGASGRNGGWLSGLAPGHRALLAKQHGRQPVIDWQHALNDAVDEVIAVARREGIDADIVKGGTLDVARNEPQVRRLRAQVDEDRSWGDDDTQILSKDEAAQRVNVDGLLLAAFTPHCARVQPAKLARGLADVVERLGVTVYEQTPVTDILPGRAVTARGTVRAPIILRATEGFTTRMPGLKRRWLPMNSAMIATDPLPADVWASIGWEGRETLGDTAHGFFYAQRTADDRIAIGGRAHALPLRFGHRPRRRGRRRHHQLPDRCPERSLPADPRRGYRPRLVRRAGRAPRLVGGGVAGSADGPGLGRRLRRPRRDRDQSRRTDAGRPGAAAGHAAGADAVGRPPLPHLGAGTVAMVGCSRNVFGLQAGRRPRSPGGRASTSPIAVVADLIARRP